MEIRNLIAAALFAAIPVFSASVTVSAEEHRQFFPHHDSGEERNIQSSRQSFMPPQFVDTGAIIRAQAAGAGFLQFGASPFSAGAFITTRAQTPDNLKNLVEIISFNTPSKALVYDPAGLLLNKIGDDLSFLPPASGSELLQLSNVMKSDVSVGGEFALVSKSDGSLQAAEIVSQLPAKASAGSMVVIENKIFEWSQPSGSATGSWQELQGSSNPNGATVGPVNTRVSLKSGGSFDNVPVLSSAPASAPRAGDPKIAVFNDEVYMWEQLKLKGASAGAWTKQRPEEAYIVQTVSVSIPGKPKANRAWVADSLPGAGEMIKTPFAMLLVGGKLYMQTLDAQGQVKWEEVQMAQEGSTYQKMGTVTVNPGSAGPGKYKFITKIVKDLKEITEPLKGQTVILEGSGGTKDRIFWYDYTNKKWIEGGQKK